MAREVEIKVKYSNERVRALRSALSKKNINLEAQLGDLIDNLYKKSVKSDVREFIEELEEEDK